MSNSQHLPGSMDSALEASLGSRMPPSSSSVPPLYRETTICYAYLCPYAYGCREKASRPAQVMMRRCMRYLPESMRIRRGLSDLALDLLATQRRRGAPLAPETMAFLDRLRPNGPIRKQVQPRRR